MKVLLVFPPQWAPFQPYLSLPSLAAFLQAHGVPVVQKDFNIEAYQKLLSRRYLEGLAERLSKRFEAMESRSSLDPHEQRLYNALFVARAMTPSVAGAIDEAAGVFRSKKDFYRLDRLAWSRKTIDAALGIISMAYHPSVLDLMFFDMGALEESVAGIRKATQDRQENPYIELYESDLLPYIRRQAPDVVGISIVGKSQLVPGLTLSRMLKSCYPGHVVVGGGVFTQLADVLPRVGAMFGEFFDSVVLYEGEKPLLELVRRLEARRDLDGVPNLVYHDGTRVRAGPLCQPAEIDSLPTPCFDGLPLKSYLAPEVVLPLLSSRGCHWQKCAFCFHGLIYAGGHRSRNSELVVNDIQKLSRKHRTVYFTFSDEEVLPGAFKALSEEIVRRRLKVRCLANARFDRQFTEDLCRKIAWAGFKILHFGLESGCDRVLKHMRKGTDTRTVVEVSANVCRAGLWNHLFTFFGFPTETREEANETVEFLLANRHIIRSFSNSAFVLGRGSPAAQHPETYGITSIEVDPSKELQAIFRYATSVGLSLDEARNMSDAYMDKIANEYETGEILKNLGYDNLLLYLTHYEKTDPFLKTVGARRPAPASVAAARCQLGPGSVPAIRKGVYRETLRFDIPEIQAGLLRKEERTAGRRETPVMFEPDREKVVAVTLMAGRVLDQCDGKATLRQIATVLAKDYAMCIAEAERDCVAFLEGLSADGFITVRNPWRIRMRGWLSRLVATTRNPTLRAGPAGGRSPLPGDLQQKQSQS